DRREPGGRARHVDPVRIRARPAGGPADLRTALCRGEAAERGACVPEGDGVAQEGACSVQRGEAVMSAAAADNGWETVIGLEIHAQLSTQSKIFSGSPTAFGNAPNSQANLVDLAYPGVLPVLNQEAVRMAVKFGLAVGASVAPRSVFARKN